MKEDGGQQAVCFLSQPTKHQGRKKDEGMPPLKCDQTMREGKNNGC